MALVDAALARAVDLAWGWPLIVLLVGGGAYLVLLSRFLPFLGLRHAFAVIRGDFDDPNDPGEISHLQALSTALAATVGVSNIAGVAIAITQGGPGAVFWMWMTAIVGMATKFFTCTLAQMYRKEDEDGIPQGGPMYYIEVGLGPRWRWMAVAFSMFGLVGCLAMFQANQLAEVMREGHGIADGVTGVVGAIVVGIVILGGIKRIGRVTEKLVPLMCGLYLVASLYILATRIEMIPGIFRDILTQAFTGQAALGGTIGGVIAVGVKRAAFSNEAGIGTAPMAHGAAKTDEPVREGLVAMVGPLIDTLIICTMTAFVILSAGPQTAGSIEGVALTQRVFEGAMGPIGHYLVTTAVILFGISTMFGYSYYGEKCFVYLFGKGRARIYQVIYIASLITGAVWSADTVVNLLDTGFALMAFPNMVATLILAPKVMTAVRAYYAKMG